MTARAYFAASLLGAVTLCAGDASASCALNVKTGTLTLLTIEVDGVATPPPAEQAAATYTLELRGLAGETSPRLLGSAPSGPHREEFESVR